MVVVTVSQHLDLSLEVFDLELLQMKFFIFSLEGFLEVH